MNKKYTIRYSKLFYNDLQKIINYISQNLDNKEAANNLLNEIEESILKRSIAPEAFEKYNSIKPRKNTYYRIYVKNYTIFYVVIDSIMEIRRILYSKREFNKLKF
ncbi:MAG: type II toxin-antitoxin system RelE/ParE family toxin [Clostridiales bacterium]|nr:type II toxin-antitoxin system RelE/ParE family toxin [Clostridiales bacterium]